MVETPLGYVLHGQAGGLVDDQEVGEPVVALAALTNALRLTGRTPANARVVISGAGA